MTDADRKQMRRLAIWMNAMTDAWNMGEAPWLYTDGNPIKIFNAALETSGGRLEAAVDAVVSFAVERGIDPRRHRLHR